MALISRAETITPPPTQTNIIVHILNPEGIDIFTIEGPYWLFNAQIYVDDEMVAGIEQEETIPIPPGDHEIKAVYNGIAKSIDVNLRQGENRHLFFVFQREEIAIEDLVNTSDSASGSDTVKNDYGYGFSLGVDFSNEIRSAISLAWVNATWPGESASAKYNTSINYMVNYPIINASGNGGFEFSDNVNVLQWERYAVIETLGTDKAFMLKSKPFKNWFIQYFYDYSNEPTFKIVLAAQQEDGNTYKQSIISDHPNVQYSNSNYSTSEIDASMDWKYIYITDIKGPFFAYKEGTEGTNFNSNSFRMGVQNVNISSIPYDLLGTGKKLKKVSGFVYKDENNNNSFENDLDISIPYATVAVYKNSSKWTDSMTDENGRYEIMIPEDSSCDLKITKPSGIQTYDPETDKWSEENSTINGELKGVNNSGELNIKASYRLLDYGPQDFKWELWHRGPVFEDLDNTILLHGIQTFTSLLPKQSDDIYTNLDDYLQTKQYGRYNAWQFEYANATDSIINHGTPKAVDIYSQRMGAAIDLLSGLSPNKNNNVISHSMGGIVARRCIQMGYQNKINKLMMLATPNMGLMKFYDIPLSLSTLFTWLSKPASELRADSSFMWNLNTITSFSTLPETAVIGGTSNAPLRGKQDEGVEIASVSLVQSNPEGSISKNFYFTGVFEKHTNIDDIDSEYNETLFYIRTFLSSGVSGLQQVKQVEAPKDYGGNPFLTFALKKRAPLYYPYVETYDGQGQVLNQYSPTRPANQDETIPHPSLSKWKDYVWTQGSKTSNETDASFIYTVQLYPEDAGGARVYFNDNEYATVKISQGQSTYVTEPIDNSASDTDPNKGNRGYVSFSNSSASPETGGQAQAGSSGLYTGHSIYVPPNAINEENALSVAEPIDNHGLKQAVDFGPNGLTFNKEAAVTVEYKDDDVLPGHFESEMRLVTWKNGRWNEVLGSSVNTDENTVSGQVSHLSIYAAMVWPNTTISSSFSANGLSGWYKTVPKINLRSNIQGISYYKWNRSSWITYISPFGAQRGINTLYYYSSDSFGNIEYVKSRIFKVDDYRPRTYASRKAIVKRGKYAKLYWKVTDPYTAGKAYVILKIKKGTRVVKTIKLGLTSIGSTRYVKYKTLLKKGKYKFYVYAQDRAGNVQRNIAGNSLFIK